MITNKDIRVENGNLVLNGDKFPLDGQSPETIMEIVEENSDTTPTENSTAPITSGGVFTADKAISDTIGDLTQTGLTGDNVAGQLGDAKDRITTVDSRVSAFTLGAHVDITSYTSSSNSYTCPSDGYLRLVVNGGGSGWVMVNDQSTMSSTGSSSANTVAVCMFVKKGMNVYLGAGNQALLYFIPLS